MLQVNRSVPVAAGAKRWAPLGGIALLAVIAGVGLPRLMDTLGPTVEPPPASRNAARDGDLTYTPPTLPEAPDAKSLLLRLSLGSVILLSLAVGCLYLGRRWLVGTTGKNGGGNQRLRLIETLPLGNRCCVYLLQVDDRPVLAGTDVSGLQTLVPLPDSFAATLEDTTGAETDSPGLAG